MKHRYQYSSELEYELHTYEEKINFAKYQVESQLNSAILRKKQEDFELKLYGGVLLIMIALVPVAIIFAVSDGVLVVLGVIIIFILIVFFIFIMPVCIYKSIKGILLWIVNRQKFLGKWIMERYEIPTCGNEIYNCQIWLGKYKMMLEDIERWKEEIKEGKLLYTEEQIQNKFHQIDLEPQIQVATEQNGEVLGLTKRVTIYLLILIYSFIIGVLRNLFGEIYNSMVELFRAI